MALSSPPATMKGTLDQEEEWRNKYTYPAQVGSGSWNKDKDFV